MKRFIVGDVVELELGKDSLFPRCVRPDGDPGGSGTWVEARVVELRDEDTLFCTQHGEGLHAVTWWWPQEPPPGDNPGWVRHLRPKAEPVCECGALKARTSHSDWCPMHGRG